MRAFRILSKVQKISIRLEVMTELLPPKFCRPWRSQNWDQRSASILAITSKRIEIFWILDKILKALIEADRMVPLSRVYDLDFMDFENFNEKKTYRKKTYPGTFFFPSDLHIWEFSEFLKLSGGSKLWPVWVGCGGGTQNFMSKSNLEGSEFFFCTKSSF